jgi:hypothetical protein
MTFRWIRYRGPHTDAAECERVRGTALYKIGDTVLVWANEGDLYGPEAECMDPRDPPTLDELRAENERLLTALRTIRDGFGTDGRSADERVADLQGVATDALRSGRHCR